MTPLDILANDIYQHCPDLKDNYCGDTHCVACLANTLYNAGYRKQEWISVDERLPEKWQRVLVNYNGNVCISWQNANGTWFECWNDKVTHWLPLPETPKMKGGE